MQTISAAVTREGRILGTVAYMSPEQARGLDVDARSDVFTFGIVLYEMATGKSPFQGETITDTLTAILRDPQPPVAHVQPAGSGRAGADHVALPGEGPGRPLPELRARSWATCAR